MAPIQPFPPANRTSRLDVVLCKMANTCIALMALGLLFSGTALAQGGVPLVTVATDQSSLNLSNQFGVPAGTAVNQAGDFAFVGNGETALFLRAAGVSTATRLLQIDDEVPGFPGSRLLTLWPELGINSSRSLLFGVRFTGGDNLPHSALLIYDGTNYHTVVTSDGIAPGSNGATYGLELIPGSIDDSGDIDFAAVPTGVLAATFYIVPSGGSPVRIVGLSDAPPASCTWCVASSISLGSFLQGVRVSSAILTGTPYVPALNGKGQMLLSLWGGLFIGDKGGGFAVVPMAGTGVCSPQAVTTQTGLIPILGNSAFLNDAGAVAFSNPPNSGSAAICVVTPGSTQPTPAVTGGVAPAPASLGGTITSPLALGLDDSGDIVYQSPISGSNVTPFALLRYHPSNGQSEVVAYDCEQAPGTNGNSFSPLLPCTSWAPGGVISISTPESAFGGVSIANGGSVSFNASLSNGQNAIYRQTDAHAPEFISYDVANSLLNLGIGKIPIGVGVGIPSIGIFSPFSQTEILDSGSVFFSSYLTGGAADFAVSLGTPGNVQSLMSTADNLPSGARTILGAAAPRAAGHFVTFTAQPAAGRINLLESDLTSGAITRVVSDNDPALATAGGPPGNKVLAGNYFLNDNGQVAFETASASAVSGVGVISLGGPSTVDTAWSDLPFACGAIFLWSPSGGLKKVVAAGDAAPNSSAKFSCVTLNATSPSPLNPAGEVLFSSPNPLGQLLSCFLCGGLINSTMIVNGDFLYSATGTISEIAAASDTLSGQSLATTFVPSLPVPVNSAEQVAFGAELGTTTWGFYLENGTDTRKIVANGDPIPQSSATFGFPHFISGLTDSGNLAFTAATSAAAEGLFFAPAVGAIQTIALDGGAAPVLGGTFSLVPATPPAPPGSFTIGSNPFQSFAAINEESDIAFAAPITGGSGDSGYFRLLQSGPAAGTLQAIAWQGEAAPGGGNFNTIAAQSNLPIPLGVNANFALGPDGSLAFVNPFSTSSGLKDGMFVARPDGTLVKVVATGDPLPGGGVLAGLTMSPKLAAGDAGKFAFLAGIAGGNARRAVFVTAIPPGTSSTTTLLGPLQNPVVAQQTTVLTAMVTSATTATGATQAAPTGNVTFFANGIPLGAGALNLSGQATLTTSALAAGQDSLLAQYDGDSNYAPGNSDPLAVVVAGFGPPPSSLTVTSGKSLVIPLTLFAPAGSNMSFSLSCSALPANTTCMFDKNPVTPGPSGTMVRLTFTTMAGANALSVPPHRGTPALRNFGLATLLTAFFALAMLFWRQAPRLRLAFCAGLGTLALAIAIAGCGASSYSPTTPVTSGTPPGLTSFTVTGISGSTTVSTIVKVTVQ
jgi:hypothetical protein